MTAIYTEGFETVGDQTDMIARGMLQNALYTNGYGGSVAIASRTGQPGKGLYLRGPYNSATVGPPLFAANYPDFGLIPLGLSVNAAWNAGGFTLGWSASFNANNFVEIAPGGIQQLVYDGSQYYWAIYRNANSGAWGICYSTDLQNWNITLTNPGTISQNSTISVYGHGLNATVLVSFQSRSVGATVYYTTNQGMSWTAMTMTGGAVTYTSLTLPLMPSGPSGPLVTGAWPSTTGIDVVYFSSITASPTRVVAALAPAGTHGFAATRISNGYFLIIGESMTDTSVVPTSGETAHIAYCLTSADPSNAANWTVMPALNADSADVCVFNNTLVVCGYNGFYYSPLTGPGAGTWFASPSFAWGATFTAFSMANNGTTLVAVGNDSVNTNVGAIYTSTDGVHWTKQNQFMYSNAGNANTAFTSFVNVLWDGSRFIATGGINNGMIIVSPDGLTWECLFVTDYVEQAATNTFSMMGVHSGQISAAGLFTPWAAVNGANIAQDVNAVGVTAAPVGNNARQVSIIYNTGNYQGQGNVNYLNGTAGASLSIPATPPVLGQQPGSSLTHYFELMFTPGGVLGNFNIQWAVDGQVQSWALNNVNLCATSDVGQMQLFFCIPRHGVFNVVDDIYLTTTNGQGNSGRLGPQSIFAVDPKTVVAGAFSNSSGTKTNAQVANEELSNSENYLYTNAAGTKDVYTNSNLVPANYVVRAVQADAFMSSGGTGLAVTGQVGVKSGSTNQAGSAITPAAAGIQTRSTLLMETDPNTGAAFTNAALNALDLTITRTT